MLSLCSSNTERNSEKKNKNISERYLLLVFLVAYRKMFIYTLSY